MTYDEKLRKILDGVAEAGFFMASDCIAQAMADIKALGGEPVLGDVEVSIVYPEDDVPHLLITGPPTALGAVHHFYRSFPEFEVQYGPRTPLTISRESNDEG